MSLSHPLVTTSNEIRVSIEGFRKLVVTSFPRGSGAQNLGDSGRSSNMWS